MQPDRAAFEQHGAPEQTLEVRDQIVGVPAGGLFGFETRRLDDDVFREVRARYRAAARHMEVEAGPYLERYLATVHRTLPASLVHIDAEFNRVLLELLKPFGNPLGFYFIFDYGPFFSIRALLF